MEDSQFLSFEEDSAISEVTQVEERADEIAQPQEKGSCTGRCGRRCR